MQVYENVTNMTKIYANTKSIKPTLVGTQQSTKNWHGPEESDWQIKTKHCNEIDIDAKPFMLFISAQCSECQDEEIQPSMGKWRE